MKKFFLYTIILTCIFLYNTDLSAFEISIKAGKLTLHANKAPLQNILQRISDTGINIYIDPRINPKISASFEDRDLQEGLSYILRPSSYILKWKSIKNSPGNFSGKEQFKLAEIKIFKEGKENLIKPVEPIESGENTGDIETKFITKRNLIYLSAILGDEGNEIETWMLLDTGATVSVIHKDIADKLNSKKISKRQGKIADGTIIDVDAIKLDYLKIGSLKRGNLYAHVIDHKGSSFNKGILGMNFLRNFDYNIDFERQVIKWKPKYK